MESGNSEGPFKCEPGISGICFKIASNYRNDFYTLGVIPLHFSSVGKQLACGLLTLGDVTCGFPRLLALIFNQPRLPQCLLSEPTKLAAGDSPRQFQACKICEKALAFSMLFIPT